MDHAARCAFIYAQSVCCLARIEAMKAENQERFTVGKSPAYGFDAFEKVPQEFGISHNQVIEYLRG